MLDRRSVLRSGIAVLAVSGAAMAKTNPKSVNPEAVKLGALCDAFMDETLDASPELATALGLDTGPRSYEKGMLADHSLAAVAALKELNTSQLARLRAVKRDALTGVDGVNDDVLLYGLAQQEEADKRFQYGSPGAGAPYVVYQLGGTYQSVPDFLDSQHQIANKQDADDYLARLAAFATALDQECEVARHDIALGGWVGRLADNVSPPNARKTRRQLRRWLKIHGLTIVLVSLMMALAWMVAER